jgi:DNA-binding response OmpR family regulator
VTDTLLLVEDDAALRTFLADNLTADGFELLVAGTAREARALLEARAPAVAIVDVGLPDASGLSLITRVRAADPRFARIDPQQRFLVLSGRGTELDRIRGLQHGADDYVAKPFSYPELLLRVQALLRRGGGRPGAARLRVGELEVDPPTRDVRVSGQRVELSAKEFSLLRALAADPTRVWTKEELLREVWGFGGALGTTRTLDSHACRLRSKLSVAGERFVVNVWGVGYRLVEVAQ